MTEYVSNNTIRNAVYLVIINITTHISLERISVGKSIDIDRRGARYDDISVAQMTA